MRAATPDRRPTPLSRREKSNTPMRQPKNGERSKFCGSTRSSSNVAQSEETTDGRSGRVNVKNNTTAGPLRSSQLFGDRPPATTTLPPRCVYAPPPTNPKQAAEFWTRMREDNARLAEAHERVCQSKGIAFRPGRRSGSSAPPRGGMDAHPAVGRRAVPDEAAPLPGSRRRTGSRNERVRRTSSAASLRKPDTPVKKVNGNIHTLNNAGNHNSHATTVTSATTTNGTTTTTTAGATKAKQRGTTNGVAGRLSLVRPRPTISASATASSHNNTRQSNRGGTYIEPQLHQGNGVANKEQDSKIQRQRAVSTPSCGEISGGASPETISSRRLNCRMETAPYVEGSGGEQSERCSPIKLQYEQYEPPVVQ
ncbi:hypothetical protein LSM04_005743 [Trypanosoma melophagium]|uniref:uncharacterized protein n=1 Tax=Trypanosoma melophagium TaxID=715481 RepID=UPI00351A3235|nr:hypothetical protein LSM04_005743 [Trypanosoma melophagium]